MRRISSQRPPINKNFPRALCERQNVPLNGEGGLPISILAVMSLVGEGARLTEFALGLSAPLQVVEGVLVVNRLDLLSRFLGALRKKNYKDFLTH